ncbi:MAG TPA: iron-containing alcohol dehydrogenase [Spirochaetes bacterium]|nr:iron-containing alcohol dehydrogenase [Spirochaetota bacterium]
MLEFNCAMPKVTFGAGKINELGMLSKTLGKKAFLAVDPFLEKTGLSDELTEGLKKESIEVFKFSEIKPDPSCFAIDKAGSLAKEEACDFVIAVGGGSTLDFGKGIAVVAGNPGTSWQYTRRQDHTPKVPGENTLPIVSVPTTAGTGSEATHFSVLSNPEIREKSTIAHERIIPRVALVDPQLTVSMPSKLTALTGIDVLAHAIESFINIKATPFSKMVSIEAIRLVGMYLSRAVRNGRNMIARENMAWASTLAGIAIAHANPTLPHALGQAAGGYVHAPHGASVAACLLEILKISFMEDQKSFGEIALALDPSVRDLSPYEKAKESVTLVERLFKDIDCCVRFGDLGLKEEDIHRVTEIALTGYFTGINLHPKTADKEEIIRIYRACL